MNGIEYIRDAYGVPAWVRGRVRYTDRDGHTSEGTITGTSGPHLLIRLDGERYSRAYHPKSEGLEYLDKRPD